MGAFAKKSVKPVTNRESTANPASRATLRQAQGERKRQEAEMVVTRFAPSPNGSLHLGHAYAAIVAHDLATARGGRFVLRIEDIDGARSRAALADAFRADLAWLGLAWDEVAPQSSRVASYAAAAERLRAMGLLYPCRCTRAEIAAAALAKGPD